VGIKNDYVGQTYTNLSTMSLQFNNIAATQSVISLLVDESNLKEYGRPSPVACIIKERFSKYYTGKLTWREINMLKKKMDNCKETIEENRKKSRNERSKLRNSIQDESRLCNDDCKKELNEHIELCKSKHICDLVCIQHKRCFTCDEDYVSYGCRFEENGRCSHYYAIKHYKEILENYAEQEDENTDSYLDYKIEFERALAIKEDRYEEYIAEDYFD